MMYNQVTTDANPISGNRMIQNRLRQNKSIQKFTHAVYSVADKLDTGGW